jgi:hypothetical protein
MTFGPIGIACFRIGTSVVFVSQEGGLAMVVILLLLICGADRVVN